jgi:hypothetical protein
VAVQGGRDVLFEAFFGAGGIEGLIEQDLDDGQEVALFALVGPP